MGLGEQPDAVSLHEAIATREDSSFQQLTAKAFQDWAQPVLAAQDTALDVLSEDQVQLGATCQSQRCVPDAVQSGVDDQRDQQRGIAESCELGGDDP
jgi:hypothetical protein